MNNTLTFGSLFSGIGGIDLGLERAGMQCAWQCEIDEYAQKVLGKHWPNVARYGDIRTVGAHNLAPVDLLAGGFPCQPHSLAGKRQASGDDRDLWGEFYRVICELKPRYVLAENVPGLLSSEDGRFFGRVLRDLAACGYDAEWQVLSAASVGAQHKRDRVFIVAHADGRHGNGWSKPNYRRSNGLTLGSATLADATSRQRTQRAQFQGRWNEVQAQRNIWPDASGRGEYVADADRQSLAVGQIFGCHAEQELAAFKRDCSTGTGIWSTQSPFCGVADGVPKRVDRLKGLGNAVVPQVAEYVGRCILASLESEAIA